MPSQILLPQEDLQKTILEAISDAVYLTDEHGHFVFVCKNVDVIFGYSQEEVEERKNIDQLIPHLDKSILAASEEITNIELEVETKNQTKRHVLLNVKPVDISGGKLLFSLRDITERKKAEEKIAYLALLLEQVSNAIITIDFDNVILSWNKHAEKLYQWTEAEAVGENIIELLSPDELKTNVLVNFEDLNRDGHWEGDFEVKRKDGTTIPTHITNTYLQDFDGNNVGFIGVSYDITARKQAEQKLQDTLDKLESRVEERTKKWHEEMNKKEELFDVMVGREVRMADLKNVIKKLRKQIHDAGMTPIANDPFLGFHEEY